jgi:hypothetical protein
MHLVIVIILSYLQLKETTGVHNLYGSDMCTRRKSNDTPNMTGDKMCKDLGEMQQTFYRSTYNIIP